MRCGLFRRLARSAVSRLCSCLTYNAEPSGLVCARLCLLLTCFQQRGYRGSAEAGSWPLAAALAPHAVQPGAGMDLGGLVFLNKAFFCQLGKNINPPLFHSVPKRRKGRKNLKGNLKNAETKYFCKKCNCCLKWKFGVDKS